MSQIIKSEGTVQDFSHSDTNDKFEGIPKTTFIFNNLLDRVTDLTESFHTRGCGLLQGKDANWNQPRQEAHRAECRRGRPNTALLAIRLLWGCVTSSGHAVRQCAQGTATQGSSPMLVVSEFLLGLNCKLPICLAFHL